MDDCTPSKFCHKCQRALPLSEFYKSGRTSDGLREYCIDCCFVYKGRARPPVFPPALDGTKRCVKCHEVFPATTEYFNQALNQRSGLNPKCRQCRMGERRGQPESDEAKRKRKIYSLAHSAEAVARAQEWERNNPERARQNRHIAVLRYRARKRALPDTLTTDDWSYALTYFNNCCAICGRPPGLWHKIAADHWIPLTDPARCPGTVKENIMPLCQGLDGCNNSKSGSDPTEWLTWKFGKRKANLIVARIEAYFASLK